mgnify:CR=1 FL=1
MAKIRPLSKEQQRALEFIRRVGGSNSGLRLYDYKVTRATLKALERRGLIEKVGGSFVVVWRLSKEK